MNDIAIRVENLGKKYTLGGQKSGSFRESLTRMFRRGENGPGRRAEGKTEDGKPIKPFVLRSPSSVPPSEFWALQDINFEIKRGEAVGIIGRNGAGKSTLLKILSRITEPTKGRFEIFGRVSSLLEVGTGFHPELTGRENVYLNGTILGMKRREVKAKFDEIVDFSGVEKFIDTPVKHYSSGMQVRLAFAVAAHLEPEILIIDEVLAVGDAEFQKKCLGKMEDVTGEGRTVLFVSHNMGAVKELCGRCIRIENGTIVQDDISHKVIAKHLEVEDAVKEFCRDLPALNETKFTYGKAALVSNLDGIFYLHLSLQVHSGERKRNSIDVKIKDYSGQNIAFGSAGTLDNDLVVIPEGRSTHDLYLSLENFAEGEYLIDLDLTVPNVKYEDRLENCLSFSVIGNLRKNYRAFSQAWGYGSIEVPVVRSLDCKAVVLN